MPKLSAKKLFLLASLLFIFLTSSSKTTAQTSISAFPGAEGFGSTTPGGRGGKVVEVTNLNNSGTGSLRTCIDATGPRICVFKTGGTIELGSSLKIKNPYITIAGQTAPGGGITLKNNSSTDNAPVFIQTDDVILRYIRVRVEPSTEQTGSLDGISLVGTSTDKVTNVIIDHCSVSWGVDEVLGSRYIHDAAFQWSIFSEALKCSVHLEGCHSMGFLMHSTGSGNASVHHNLFVHNDYRNPQIFTSLGGDVVNNVVYNSRGASIIDYDAYPNVKVSFNFVGNYLKGGLDRSPSYYLEALDKEGVGFELFLQGNICPARPNNNMSEDLAVSSGGRKWVVSTRHNAPLVTTTSAFDAYDQVLADAGANKGLNSDGSFFERRDFVDQRVVSDVINGTGRIIDDPSEVGGFPIIESGIPYTDSDHDGMADEWETMYFGDLNRGSTDDSSGDYDNDGYTDLEEFLNGTNPKDESQYGPPGDINCDGKVDVRDLLIVLTKWGSNDASADLDSSGKVDVPDLIILLINFGQTA